MDARTRKKGRQGKLDVFFSSKGGEEQKDVWQQDVLAKKKKKKLSTEKPRTSNKRQTRKETAIEATAIEVTAIEATTVETTESIKISPPESWIYDRINSSDGSEEIERAKLEWKKLKTCELSSQDVALTNMRGGSGVFIDKQKKKRKRTCKKGKVENLNGSARPSLAELLRNK